MKTSKRILATLLAALTLFSLTACASRQAQTTTPAQTTQQPTQQEAPAQDSNSSTDVEEPDAPAQTEEPDTAEPADEQPEEASSDGGKTLVVYYSASGNTATVADITVNTKHLKIAELEAAQLPRSLEDVDVACVPMNYAISGKLSPEKQGFYFESREAPFALMVIAARPDNAESKNVKAFVKAYQSPEVKAFIETTFKGAVKAAW